MPDPVIRMTIVRGNATETCGGGCGDDWTSPDVIGIARQAIATRFGDKVVLSCIDLGEAEGSENYYEVRNQIAGMPLPVLLSHDRPRIAGSFDLRQLLDVIEADLEGELE